MRGGCHLQRTRHRSISFKVIEASIAHTVCAGEHTVLTRSERMLMCSRSYLIDFSLTFVRLRSAVKDINPIRSNGLQRSHFDLLWNSLCIIFLSLAMATLCQAQTSELY